MISAGTENDLYEVIARYLKLQYPEVPFHFDQSGMWTSSHKARNLYARLNSRAWPDLFIAFPIHYPGMLRRTPGLFLELKVEGTRLKKRDGTWASTHILEQSWMLEKLQNAGYVATFACGFDEAKELIDSYLNPAIPEAA